MTTAESPLHLADDAPEGSLPLATRVCGLSIPLRTALTFQKAGATALIVHVPASCEADVRALLDDARLRIPTQVTTDPAPEGARDLRVTPIPNAPRLLAASDVGGLEAALLAWLRRPSDGLISRLLNRPVSLRISRLVSRTPLTPNGMTFLTWLVGLAGGALAFGGTYLHFLLGAFLYHVASILDGCDGEIARLKFQSSRLGEWFDTLADDSMTTLFVIGLCLGLANRHDATAPEWSARLRLLVWVNVVSVGVFIGFIYHHLLTRVGAGSALAIKWWFEVGDPKQPSGAPSLIDRLLDTLKYVVRRDFFIFAFFILSIFDLNWLSLALLTLANIAMLIVLLIQLPKWWAADRARNNPAS